MELERAWTHEFHQALAALEPFHTEQQKTVVMAMLVALVIDKPKPNISESQAKILLRSRMQSLSKYSVEAIKIGIRKLVENSDNPFFPSAKELIKYIHPIQREMYRYVSALDRVLKHTYKYEEQALTSHNDN